MKKYDFNTVLDRRNTDCIKYDAALMFLGADIELPLWVADMDFPSPDFVLDALRERLNHPILGYQFHSDSFYQPFIEWVSRRHNWSIQRQWLSFSPGVVPALSVAVLSLTSANDKIIVQPPVYFPFFECVEGNGRHLIENPLLLKDGRYYFDFENLEQNIDDSTKMLILSNPHNPGGMVWTKDELLKLASICQKYNILVLSDEIHCDLLFNGYSHTPFASLNEWTAQNSLTCMAPSKTFNLSGLSTSYVIMPNIELKAKFDKLASTLHINLGNIAGTVAANAAYTYGDSWLNQLMEYIEENYMFLNDFFSQNLPDVDVMKPEATFLVWLDFRKYNFKDGQLNEILLHKAKVGLNKGEMFGTGGDGFMRINIACPRKVLSEACFRIHDVLKDYDSFPNSNDFVLK